MWDLLSRYNFGDFTTEGSTVPVRFLYISLVYPSQFLPGGIFGDRQNLDTLEIFQSPIRFY
jgi:hypothetical protein